MWIDCTEKMPPEDMEVVIALYRGFWPGRGNSGIADIYAVDGKWFNIPEGVTIVGWMPVPDTSHLPVAEQCIRRLGGEAPKLLGCVETGNADILECIFEGDCSDVNKDKQDRKIG